MVSTVEESSEHAQGEARLFELVTRMSLPEKVQVLTARDFWSTWPLESIGLRRILVSDGPSGVRGPVWDERDPSLNLPSSTALASSWDPAMARRYGAAAAVEARRKDVDVVLGPTINLHRSPLGGRHFECLSEDPRLTGALAAAYVGGVQSNGVGAAPKHFVANDSETDRFTVDARVSDRALRELYLLPFEMVVAEAGAWLVMSAYNSVNGVTATENDLLETPLNSEWGFDGVVISDWTAVRSLESAKASQDLVFPGPGGPWGDALADAVRSGQIHESIVDRKVLRVLRLAQRVGALDSAAQAPTLVEDGAAFAREASIDGTVLLKNADAAGEPLLPWDATQLRSVAVIGDNAANVRTQGGGSATVVPPYTVSPLAGLREALPRATVTYAVGAASQVGLADLPPGATTNPVTGTPGLRVRFLDAEGAELFAEDRMRSTLLYLGGPAPLDRTSRVEVTTTYTPEDSASVRLGFAMVGHGTVWVDDEVVVDATLAPEGDDLAAALLAPPHTAAPVTLEAGRPVRVRFEVDRRGREALPAMAFQIGTKPEAPDAAELIADAVRVAAEADVALVVVGTNAAVESEGFDRTTLALPGHQDDLVRAVVAANPRTVVLVNAGAPVLMPWRDEVAAVLVGYFGGQEFGHAVADVLLGAAEPGGRLPTTWPALETDVPVLSTTPVDGALEYAEGIHIGYRAWLKREAEPSVQPAFWFGHGLGYTEMVLTDVDAPEAVRPGTDFTVRVGVENRGHRPGKHVVQVYAERADSEVDRPVRWLVGFAPVRVDAGERAVVDVEVASRTLAHWSDGWAYEAGRYVLRVGASVADLALSTPIDLEAR